MGDILKENVKPTNIQSITTMNRSTPYHGGTSSEPQVKPRN